MTYFILITLVASSSLVISSPNRNVDNDPHCKPPAGDLKLEKCKQPVRTGMLCPTDRNPQCRTQWYYDSSYGECFQFSYAGCSGNQNNFDNRQQCEQECKSKGTTLTSEEKEAKK
ncbi:kunitz-type serine protease inhibitor bitisilin-1-like [Dermacentor variabilis]|uniref:kunitz-type serine protease inhibitor bitisilin-1-like n=1 Tax=Dermacentor variabilis TaxID=34621 RepID=UPI003F5C76F4